MGIALWGLGAVAAIAGIVKLRRLVGIVKQVREVISAYNSARKADSESGVEISGKEWRKIADESLDVIELVASWAYVTYQARQKD